MIALSALRVAAYRRALQRRRPDLPPFAEFADRYADCWVRAGDPWDVIRIHVAPALSHTGVAHNRGA